MRTSPAKIAMFVAVFFSTAALSLTGCQSSLKMPTAPNWLSWGKKKPSASSLASKPDTKLPSPSQTATPYQPPGYAQTPGSGSSYGNRAWNGTPPQPRATVGRNGYGPPTGSSQYSNATYGGRSGYQRSYDSTNTSPAQRFYSQNYNRGTQSSAYSSGTPSYAGNPASAGNGATYGSTGSLPSSAAPTASQGWPSSGSGSRYSASSGATSNYGYGGTATGGPAYGSSYGQTAPPSSLRQSPPSYGGASDGYPSLANRQFAGDGAAGAASAAPTSGPAAAPGAYRPGSTSRSTQFGDSRDINVAGLRGIQPASYGAGGSSRDAKSFPGSDQAAPGSQGPEGSRTATGGYPVTSPSIYR